MVRVLLPVRLLQEAVACAMLGAALGAVRAFLPARGRAAFVPDVLLSGAVALGRGIGAALRLPGRILHRFAVQPLCRRRAAAKTARKLRRNAERTAKKSKKNLPNQRALLYNSNVSK